MRAAFDCASRRKAEAAVGVARDASSAGKSWLIEAFAEWPVMARSIEQDASIADPSALAGGPLSVSARFRLPVLTDDGGA